MFDIGFLELVLVAVIALLVLGPERLPGAARSAGLFFGKIRRMTSQFTSEIDKQLKAEEFREKLRKEGDTLGVEHIQGTVRQALDRAKDFEDRLVRDPIAGTESIPTRASSPSQTQATAPETVGTHTPQIDSEYESQRDQTSGERTKQS